MHLRDLNASRKAGFSCAVSDLALIMLAPTDGSFAQLGMSPPLHQGEFTDGFLWMLANNGDGLCGRNVVAGSPLLFVRGAIEVLLNKLLPSRESVASAHWEIMADRIASQL